MAGVFIDPAESFSRALNQGLSTMKSYRDEERLDQDRAFEKEMKLETQRQAQEQLNLMVKRDKREQAVHDEDMSPDRVALRGRRMLADTNFAEAQAKEGKVKADNAQRVIDHDIEMDRGQLAVARSNAGASWYNARTSRMNTNLAIRQYEDERLYKMAERELRAGFQLIGRVGNNPTPENMRKLMGNKVAGSALVKMASMAYDAPVLGEILQNFNGGWINDGKKLAVALRFAEDDKVVNNTKKQQGFHPTKTKIANIRGATVKDPQGRPQQVVELTLRGPDVKTGKMKSYTGYVAPHHLFERGAMAANMFAQINRDPVAKARIVQMYQQTNESDFYKILNYEANRIEKEMKKPTHPDVVSGKISVDAYNNSLQKRLTALENGDPEVTSNLVFRFMGRMGSTS